MAKYFGIDYGERRIGIAVSDQTGLIARFCESVDLKFEKNFFAKFADMIKQHQVDEVVLGLPKNMNGTLGFKAQEVMAFADKLKSVISIPLTMWDERLTTMEAERMLISADLSRKKRKNVVDGIAAQLILQGFLDWKNNQ